MSEENLLDELLNYIESISKERKWNIFELSYFLEEQLKSDHRLAKFISFLKNSNLSPEEEGIFYYLMSNSKNTLNKDSLIGLSIIVFEIHNKNSYYFYKKSFELYNKNQTLFKIFPELFSYLRQKNNNNKDYELICLSNLDYASNGSQMDNFKYKDSYLFINSYLNHEIINYLVNRYEKRNLYIRIDPYKIMREKPLAVLKEEFLRPPNPKWIKNLKLFPGEKEGCDIFLPETKEDYKEKDKKKINQQLEYNRKKIRKLEIISTMKQENMHNHFSMSLEELSEEDIDQNRLIGRMIHLDTLNSFNTPFKEIKLNHLDLAINVYEGDQIVNRNAISLSQGKKISSASYRIHLLRADNIMMNDLIDIALMFFKSTTMVEEWIEKQFEF